MAAREESTSIGREPKRRRNIGPNFLERLLRALCTGLFKRWKWPIIGKLGGLGRQVFVLINPSLYRELVDNNKNRD